MSRLSKELLSVRHTAHIRNSWYSSAVDSQAVVKKLPFGIVSCVTITSFPHGGKVGIPKQGNHVGKQYSELKAAKGKTEGKCISGGRRMCDSSFTL